MDNGEKLFYGFLTDICNKIVRNKHKSNSGIDETQKCCRRRCFARAMSTNSAELVAAVSLTEPEFALQRVF